ncbi:antA/AntB antirepressor family protein [Enterococcus casseliflavus]|jgi:Phage anti-repressor protein|uniref:antA/AntB antirepressor family protein n=1 Tax=Enterococcus casseliflavus TaxID=37734 RepID=UPI002DBD48D5|nr:antA/AntB antirepressor family protein [Enterococcus casseliflavus]MEB6179725.1 antA/AntB antirepressor family protein [Enterococcus casseliflavus]
MKELVKVTIDANNDQLVSGRELHGFLEVKDNYTDWFKRMIKYGFEENIDFVSFSEKSDKPFGGRPQINHSLKLDMAKEVSMIQRTEKGKLARQYFIQVEKEYTQHQLDTSKLSPELQMFNGLFQAVASQEMATKRLSTKVDSISEIVALNSTDWRKDSRQLINQIAKKQGGYDAYREIQSDIYQELDRRAGSSLKIRLTNLRNRMAGEGATKSQRDKTSRLDVIAQDKRLLEIYLAIVKEFAIKYGVWNNEF